MMMSQRRIDVYKPGRNGLNVQVKLLPALVAPLSQAEERARAAGLLQDDGSVHGENTILDAG